MITFSLCVFWFFIGVIAGSIGALFILRYLDVLSDLSEYNND